MKIAIVRGWAGVKRQKSIWAVERELEWQVGRIMRAEETVEAEYRKEKRLREQLRQLKEET